MNIMISCPGRMYETVALLKAGFARSGWGVVAAGNSEQISGLYAADKAFIVPSVDDPAYVPALLEICRAHQVKAILTLLDRDIVVLSQAAELFRQNGILPLIVNHQAALTCDNKFLMYRFLQERGIPCARTLTSREEMMAALSRGQLSWPVFAKPVIGDGSRGAMKCRTLEEFELCAAQNPELIIQEFLEGPEYDVDLYVDTLSGQMVSVFAKEKLVKVIGGTATAVSMEDDELFALAARVASSLGAVGPLNVEVFKVGGEYFVGEVNPRFGATYIGAHACGVDFTPLIINNINGTLNQPKIGGYPVGVTMMKYEDVRIVRPEERVGL